MADNGLQPPQLVRTKELLQLSEFEEQVLPQSKFARKYRALTKHFTPGHRIPCWQIHRRRQVRWGCCVALQQLRKWRNQGQRAASCCFIMSLLFILHVVSSCRCCLFYMLFHHVVVVYFTCCFIMSLFHHVVVMYFTRTFARDSTARAR
jgi:hypothetical protein